MDSSEFQFSDDWFSRNIQVWDLLIERGKPLKILEIGSYEGRSACYLINTCTAYGALELVCVDTWRGGVDHDATLMAEVERRFDRNIALAKARAPGKVEVRKIKAASNVALAALIHSDGRETFDLIYIDGSHTAPDVLTDAVLAFELLRVQGLMIFDDYLWSMEPPGQQDPLNMPKPAIDAFVNIFQRKLMIYEGTPNHQLYCEKVSS